MGYAGAAGWSELGRSLSGIGRTVADKRLRLEEEKRLAEQEEYARDRETEQDRLLAQRRAEQRELELIGLGGGPGPIPMIPRSTAPRDLFPEPGRGVHLPDFEPPSGRASRGPGPQLMRDPTMQSVTGGYVRRPTVPDPYDPATDPVNLRRRYQIDEGLMADPNAPPAPRPAPAPQRRFSNLEAAHDFVRNMFDDPRVEFAETTWLLPAPEMRRLSQGLFDGTLDLTDLPDPKDLMGPNEPTLSPAEPQPGSKIPGVGAFFERLVPGGKSGVHPLFSGDMPAEPGTASAPPGPAQRFTPGPAAIPALPAPPDTLGPREAWQSDSQAMDAIQRIEASGLPADEKERRIAEVKRRASGGR